MSLSVSLTMTVMDFVLQTCSTKVVCGIRLKVITHTRSGLSHHVDHDNFLVRVFMTALYLNGDQQALADTHRETALNVGEFVVSSLLVQEVQIHLKLRVS